MGFENTVAVVTGANRGLGRHFAQQLLERGAKVYAAVRRPENLDLPGVIPIRFDLTDPASVEQAASAASDATLLINNAGISTSTSLTDGAFDNVRLEMETHYFGTLATARAFAPVIEHNGGGSILNILSVLSWAHIPAYGAYSAAKTAAWAMTNLLRQELASRNVHVAALHVGYMDTDMTASLVSDQKADPAVVAKAGLDGIEAGAPEIIVDDISRQAKQGLSAAL